MLPLETALQSLDQSMLNSYLPDPGFFGDYTWCVSGVLPETSEGGLNSTQCRQVSFRLNSGFDPAGCDDAGIHSRHYAHRLIIETPGHQTWEIWVSDKEGCSLRHHHPSPDPFHPAFSATEDRAASSEEMEIVTSIIQQIRSLRPDAKSLSA